MKVLFLAPQPFFVERGTPIAVRAAVEALAADGHRVDLLTYHAGEDIAIPGVRILRAARPPLVRRIPIGPSWQKVLCDVCLLRSAWRCALTGGYDLVHAVEEAAFIAALLKRRLGLPFIYDMDSLMSEQIADKGRLMAPAAAAFARWERRAILSAVGVLAVCPALVARARAHHPSGRIALLPDMPLTSIGEQAPSSELAAIDGVKLVYVGNLEPYQGVDLMLRAFALIAREHPGATLIIIGGAAQSSPAAAALSRLAPDLCAVGRIRFLGPRPLSSLGSLLAGADILVSPRRTGRNTPMKLYSYLESARPVLATRLPTHTQVLEPGAALLVDPDPAAMAAGMSSLIASPQLRHQIGAAGRELVRREFSPEVFRRRLRMFYAEVEAQLTSSAHAHTPRPTGLAPAAR